MPTYGCEDFADPTGSVEPIECVYEGVLRVRDACGMSLNDAAVKRLVDAALTEYRAALQEGTR
jgi:hypothetical protein